MRVPSFARFAEKTRMRKLADKENASGMNFREPQEQQQQQQLLRTGEHRHPFE